MPEERDLPAARNLEQRERGRRAHGGECDGGGPSGGYALGPCEQWGAYILECGAGVPGAGEVHGAHLLSLIHISEPTRLRRISYAVFCLKQKNHRLKTDTYT